jgi:hypothetical protein
LGFKIGGPKVLKYQNRGTKSAFKPILFNVYWYIVEVYNFNRCICESITIVYINMCTGTYQIKCLFECLPLKYCGRPNVSFNSDVIITINCFLTIN